MKTLLHLEKVQKVLMKQRRAKHRAKHGETEQSSGKHKGNTITENDKV